MNLSRRLSMEEVAALMRQNGFPVVGDDVAWIARHGIVLDFPATVTTQSGPTDDEWDDWDDESGEDEYPATQERPNVLAYRGRFSPGLYLVAEPKNASRLGRLNPGRLARKLVRRIWLQPLGQSR